MHIAILGARGAVGSRTITEALNRGHQVTGVVRHADDVGALPGTVTPHVADVSDAAAVALIGAGHDVVISATRPAPGREPESVAVTAALLEGAALASTRILIVGGAASLTVPGEPGLLVLDDPRFVPPEWRTIAQASVAQLEVCMDDQHADWTHVSPSALMEPGRRTGRYLVGLNELLVAADGRSSISMEDLAVALLDEAERPAHRRMRFTVGS